MGESEHGSCKAQLNLIYERISNQIFAVYRAYIYMN